MSGMSLAETQIHIVPNLVYIYSHDQPLNIK